MEQLASMSISALIKILLNFTFKTAEKLPDVGASCAVEEWPVIGILERIVPKHHVLCSHTLDRIVWGNFLSVGQCFDSICNAGVSYPLNGLVFEAFRNKYLLGQNSDYCLISLDSCLPS